MEDPQNDADWNFQRATCDITFNITMIYTEFEMSDFCMLLELSMYPSLGMQLNTTDERAGRTRVPTMHGKLW